MLGGMVLCRVRTPGRDLDGVLDLDAEAANVLSIVEPASKSCTARRSVWLSGSHKSEFGLSDAALFMASGWD
jgi:hypothetical protein